MYIYVYIYIYIHIVTPSAPYNSRLSFRMLSFRYLHIFIFFSFFFLNYVIIPFSRSLFHLDVIHSRCFRTVFLYKITSLWHFLSYPASPKRLFPNCVHATHCSQGKNEYRAAGAIYTGGWC